MKASSLIPINQATVIELQLLRGIGPKRAGRIVRYREEVSNIENIHDLATATGLSLRQAEPLSQLIEWESTSFKPRQMIAPALIFLGSFLLIFYGLSEIQFDLSSPAQALYNLSLLSIMIGCISLSFEQLAFYYSGRHHVFRSMVIVSIAAFLIGIVSMISLVCITVLLDFSPILSAQVTATTNFLIFVFLIVYMINAPAIHLKRINLFRAARPRSINRAAIVFDYGHLVLAILVLTMLTKFNSGLGIEEIFAIWASVLLASSGVEMTRGKSAYVSLLSDHEKDSLQFLRNSEREISSTLRSSKLMKITGMLLLGMAALLFSLAVYQLI